MHGTDFVIGVLPVYSLPMASDSPFGKKTRLKALKAYLNEAIDSRTITAANAWTHVYRLLLSVDRRTRLAHVYDSNHMQRGGNWHKRAKRFTELLCARWGIEQASLPNAIDRMFRFCVAEYLELKEEEEEDPGSTDAADVVTEFAQDVRELLTTKLKAAGGDALEEVIAEIEKAAERYFEIERKRQNVRGEGFEDTLEYLFQTVSGIKHEQIRVRKRAPELPGFKPDPPVAANRKKPKAPKPDIALLSPDEQLTRWIVTAKWSLRQDRLDQFGQEAEYYKDNRIQAPSMEFVFVTNEMDVARLRDVLHTIPGAGGFHFERVYHLNLGLVEETHGEAFAPLAVYKQEGRLLSLEDLLVHAKAHFGAAPTSSPAPAAPRGRHGR